MRELYVDGLIGAKTAELALATARDQAAGLPNNVVFYGASGRGKTWIARHLAEKWGFAYMRVPSHSNASSLLGTLVTEMGGYPHYRIQDNFDFIVNAMRQYRRGLIFDEADRLENLLEVVRDLSDCSGQTVVFVGMAEFPRKISRLPQLWSRMAAWVELAPADVADCRLLAAQLAEVRIADDLVVRLHEQTNGSLREIVVGLSRVEQFAKARGIGSVNVGQWGTRPFTLSGVLKAAPQAGASPAAGARLQVVA